MKGLTIRQPYADQIFAEHDPKTVEYRSKPTNHRGLLFIQAGAGGHAGLPSGVIIGIVDVTGCEQYGDNEYGWLLANPTRLTHTYPFRGNLAMWNVPQDLLYAMLQQEPTEVAARINQARLTESGAGVFTLYQGAAPQQTDPDQPAVFDNVNTIVGHDLQKTIAGGSKLSVAAACFSIYAFDQLKKQLRDVHSLRFLFTSPSFLGDKTPKAHREFYIPRLGRERALYGSEFEIRLRNELNQKAIAKECADWIREKVQFRSLSAGQATNTMLTIEDSRRVTSYMGINNFTSAGLGFTREDGVLSPIMRSPLPASRQFLAMFDTLWQSGARDVTKEVLAGIEAACKDNAPETVYFLAVYNIFKEFLNDIEQDAFEDANTGLGKSAVWNALYDFQKEAARALISRLDTFNGCILADSVGLGKTFTALAVIKYYELRNKNVLVLCPKKLGDNWKTYTQNYKDNILYADKFAYRVLYHTDLLRAYGMSGDIDLARFNWNSYDLVVIDESHNFRNGGQFGDDARENRYTRLVNRVIRDGVRTKVLMLSATPVNNRFADLRNQLFLAYGSDEARWQEKLGFQDTLEELFARAQQAFAHWSKQPAEERTTAALLQDLDPDFFKILDSVTIARSRKHIEKYYDNSAVGKFPQRRKPVSITAELSKTKTISYTEIADMLDQLNLAVYNPSKYIHESRRHKYEQDSKKGLQKGRELGICRLMSTNLLKRLESSVNSFVRTVAKVQETINEKLELLRQAGEDETVTLTELTLTDDFDDDDENSGLLVSEKVPIRLKDMDRTGWQRDMEADAVILTRLLESMGGVSAKHDDKLARLYALIDDKVNKPINTGNKKMLIFTAFSDTAEYLYEHVSAYVRQKYGLHTGLVTGKASGCKTTIPKLRSGFNNILTWFSPVSKHRPPGEKLADQEIDILIGTDCISEGQNLQDCDYVVNYDIHWNPVRIIQRFGRVDRIGSKNTSIQLVNFWPSEDLDEYIKLRGRIDAKIKAMNATATGDDNPIDDTDPGDLEYRRRQLMRLKDEVVDIEEMSGGLSIMDLGLNEYRQDLLDYVQRYGEPDTGPHGVSAVVPASADCPPGVIFVLRNRNEDIDQRRLNLLHPYYMVYVRDTGEMQLDHLSQKKILDTLRLLCRGRNEPFQNLADAFNFETRDGRDMKRYSALLDSAIRSIAARQEESELDSMFTPGGTTALASAIGGLDDFELICFLVVRGEGAKHA